MFHFTPLGEQKSRQNNLRLLRAGGPANFTVLDSKHDATPWQAENEESPTNFAVVDRFYTPRPGESYSKGRNSGGGLSAILFSNPGAKWGVIPLYEIFFSSFRNQPPPFSGRRWRRNHSAHHPPRQHFRQERPAGAFGADHHGRGRLGHDGSRKHQGFSRPKGLPGR